MRRSYVILLILLPILSFSGGYDDDLNGWVGIDHQLGAWDNKFIAIGGASGGISFYGLSLGAAVYGNYPYDNIADGSNLTLIYGGGVIGYKSPLVLNDIFGFRLNILLGYATIESFGIKTGHFVLSPTMYFDFYMVDELAFSLGLTYRYFNNGSGIFNAGKIDNSFGAVVSISWIGD